MRPMVLRLLAATAFLLTGSACTDSLTEPVAGRATPAGPFSDEALEGCVKADGTGECTLPPISGGACEPWDDECEDDGGGDCMTSEPAPDDPEFVGTEGCEEPAPGPGTGGPGIEPGGGGSGGGGGSPPPACQPSDPTCSEPPADTCVTNDPVLNEPVVEAAFAELWANSNPTAPQAQRVEQAAWIVQTAYGLETITWTDADFGPCTISPHVGTFGIPTNAIGWIHTHPFTEGELQTSCEPLGYDANGQPIHGTYDKLPNEADIELAAAINASLGRNIDAYTIDQSSIVRFTATSSTTVSAYSPYGRCGY